MKKIILVALVLFSFFNVIAQKPTWIFISGGGGYGGSIFYNEAELDQSEISYNFYSPSYFFGGKLGFFGNAGIGASLNLRLNSLSQEYQIDYQGQTQYVTAIVKNLEYAVLLDFQSETGFYFNIGPDFGKTKSAILKISDKNTNETRNILDKITPNLTGAMFEAGIKPLRTDYFEINMGFFGTFFFTDLTSQPGYSLAVHDRSFFNPQLNDNKTYVSQLGFSVEFIWIFARYGRASCGKQRFIIHGL